MNKDACFELGYINKVHGLKGAVGVTLDTDYPDDYKELESVFIELNNKLVPFFIEEISITGKKATIKFEDIDTVEDAEDLKGAALFLPLTVLPPLEGKDFYFYEVIGFVLVDQNHGEIGIIKDVLDASAQHLFSVDHKGKEVLVPVNDEIIKSVDRDNKQISVDLPDGLMEIYLD